MQCIVNFPSRWLDAGQFEEALRYSVGPHAPQVLEVRFLIPAGCKIMVDAAIRLLSLANQLALTTRRVRLQFDEGESGTMGYLNRMGFFDELAQEVEVFPGRPVLSRATLHRGGNVRLVEIARINKDFRDDALPTRLTDALLAAAEHSQYRGELGGAAWTIFAELIDNVFSHSSTRLDGYAALQSYSAGNKLTVAVSDSGLGIMQTLRPTLQIESPKLMALSDVDLLVEIFRQGLSRHGAGRGCGLKGSAAKAIKFKAALDVRLPTQRVLLMPAKGEYRPNTAYCYENLPLIWGTHIGFTFDLKA